jgi:fatty acid desaturase
LFFIGAYFPLVAVQWLAPPPQLWARVALIALTCVVCWFNAVITHNVIHSPMWKNRTLNRLTQFALSLTYGFPVSDYVPGHNLSHHRYTQTRRDVMRTSKVRFRWNLMNLVFFFFAVGGDIIVANGKYASFARSRNPVWVRQRWAESVVTWGVKAALLWVNWKLCLLTILLPHAYATWGIVTVNLLQHDGCDADHPYNHSRNFVGRVFNWFTFNNGYHGLHHMAPGLHWSLLPKVHAEKVLPFMDPRLEQKSLTVYLWKTYAVPGQRQRYDGAPMSFPLEGPDEDWIGSGVLPQVDLDVDEGSGKMAAA